MTQLIPCPAEESARDLLIALALSASLTPSRWRLLYEHFQPLSRIEAASPAGLASLLSISEEEARVVRNPLQLPHVRRQVARLRESVITILDPHYPALLREIGDAPPILHYRG